MKRLIASLFAGTVLCLAAMPAYAQGTADGVSLSADGSRAAVRLQLPTGEAQDVTALQISFAVCPTAGSDAVSVTFDFDDALSAGVQQYRYDDATGELTVYLAGRTPLLSSGSMELGDICLASADGSQVDADVAYVTDSLQVADRSFGSRQPVVGDSGTVALTTAAKPAPAPSAKPESTPAPSAQPDNGGSGADDSTSTQAPQTTTAPAGSTGVTGGTGGTVSATARPSGSGSSTAPTASPAPSASPAPDADPAQTPAPEADGSADADPQTTPAPDADTTAEQESGPALPWVLVMLGVVAAGAVVALVVLFRRR